MNHTAQNCPRGKSWVVRRRACASSVNTNCGTSTERSNDEFFKACKRCKKFPGTSSQGTCYHYFAVGSTIDECPECAGKPWSEEFLEAKDEIEGPDKLLLPF